MFDYRLPGKLTLVDEKEISVAGTTFTFNNLDINTHKMYFIQFTLKNNTVSTLNVAIEVNGDTTATNYNGQNLSANGATVSGSNDNDNVFQQIYDSGETSGIIEVYRTVSGNVVSICKSVGGIGSNYSIELGTTRKIATVTNLTSLNFVGSQNFAVGSVMRLYQLSD